MSFEILPKAALSEWIQRLCVEHRVFGPKPLENRHVFAEIHAADGLDLAYPTTILPPKKVLLPAHEALFRFEADGRPLEPDLETTPTVIMGIHTCDMHALALLDRVYGHGYPDQHYLARRRNTTLVSLECLKPCSEHAFCKSMGTLVVPDEFDLHLTDLGDDYAVDIGSDRGAALLRGLTQVRQAEAADFQRVDQVMGEKWPRFPYRLEFDLSELPSLVGLSYRSTLWEELAARCLGCGSCTTVCPTCTCFDVMDEVEFSLRAGRRCRVWDSCQLNRFASVAGGHDFRASKAARLRHRFLRKGKYQTEACGLVGCVGCGRCAQACLAHITPVDTFNALYRRRPQAAGIREEILR